MHAAIRGRCVPVRNDDRGWGSGGDRAQPPGGAEFGVVLAAALVGVGIGAAGEPRAGASASRPRLRGATARCTACSWSRTRPSAGALLGEIEYRCRGHDSEVLVVTPALTSAVKHWLSDVDDAIDAARERQAVSVRAIEALGVRARGEVGDSDPNVAIEDALRSFPADE